MSLKTVLSTLLTTAERSGQPARIEMRGGLKIDLRTDATFTFLQLSRAIPIEPSARELATVLDAWPYPSPTAPP